MEFPFKVLSRFHTFLYLSSKKGKKTLKTVGSAVIKIHCQVFSLTVCTKFQKFSDATKEKWTNGRKKNSCLDVSVVVLNSRGDETLGKSHIKETLSSYVMVVRM